jgi:hypothetical protein
VEVVDQRWTACADAQGILLIGDRAALRRRQHR